MIKNKYWLMLETVLFFAAITASAKITNRDFLNKCKLPVVLTVPLYTEDSKQPKAYDIILKPGDFYQASQKGNGYLYEKYGLMPDLVTNFIKKLSSPVPAIYGSPQKELKEYEKRESELKANSMPGWWVRKCIENYKSDTNSYDWAVEELKEKQERMAEAGKNVSEIYEESFNANWSNYLAEAKLKVTRFSFVTNITESKLELLVNPEADIDNDGLTNREEFRCDTDPLYPNSVAVSPHKIKVSPNGNEIITNEFCVLNLTTTNITCRLVPNYEMKKFAHTLKGVNIKSLMKTSEGLKFSLNAKSSGRFLLLWSAKKLPYQLPSDGEINLYVGENRIAKSSLRPVVINDQAEAMEAPVIISPKEGERLPSLRNIKFAFDPKGYPTNSDWYTETFVYDINGNLMGNDFPLSFVDPLSYDLKTRLYIYGAVASSAAPFSKVDKVVTRPTYNRLYYAVNDLCCDMVRPGSYFWRIVKQSDYSSAVASDWRWFCLGAKVGSDFEKGRNKFGNEKENTEDSSKKPTSLSYYHVTEKSVVHKLIVNVPFEYYVKDFYDNFEGQKGPKLDENVQIKFSENLPQGLSGQKISGDFKISGLPKYADVYTNFFVVSDGSHTVKERHVFFVKDIGVPVPAKKPDDKDPVTFVASHHLHKVIHRMIIGKKDKYPMWLDFMCVEPEKRQLFKYEKQLTVSFLEPLPPGFELIEETKDTKGEVYHFFMLSDIPEEAGVYTNYARIVNPEFIYTNMHIFNIYTKKPVYTGSGIPIPEKP